MNQKKRYLVGYGNSAVVPQATADMINKFVTEERDIHHVRKLNDGQLVVETTEEQALNLAKKIPELIVEKDRELELFFPMPGLSARVPSGKELTQRVSVVDEKTHMPISDVTVFCVGSGVAYKGLTDKKGMANIKLFETDIEHIIASARHGYWSKIIATPKVGAKTSIDIKLREIPVSGTDNWGNLCLSTNKICQRFTGKGVKVAVIDSGIAQHENLKTTGGYNTLDGQDSKTWNLDEKGHGTHCSGIIAAEQNQMGITGMATEAEVYSLKVFPGGRFSDLLEAINWCVDNYMDVINMGMGSGFPSAQIETALIESNARGITCISAAGNNSGVVSYPAAYENVIAVSAIGKLDTFPEDSAHALNIGDIFSYDGDLFFANFSNIGKEIDLCAPGVAIRSSVPTGYASWDGTSMACAYVSGLVALILEAYPEIRTGDGWQPYYVREILRDSATDIGLPIEMQGAGLPNADLALSQAYYRLEQENVRVSSYREYLESLVERAKLCLNDLEKSITRLDHL
jgi:hypothetical protein